MQNLMQQTNYRELYHFSLQLDRHSQKSDSFFNHDLLAMVSQVSGFTELTVSVYNKRGFQGLFAHSLRPSSYVREKEEWYCREFQQMDPFASALSRHTRTGSTSNVDLLASEDIIQSDHEKASYRKLLTSLDYSACAVALPIENCRLTIHKHRSEGGFSDIEKDRIFSIGEILLQKYQSFLENEQLRQALTMQKMIMQHEGIGYVIFDEDGQLLEANNYALQYLTSENPGMNHAVSARHLFRRLHTALQNREAPGTAARLSENGYALCCSLLLSIDTPCSLNQYCVVSIRKSRGAFDSRETSIRSFKERFSLSNREMEVIELLHQGKKYEDIAKQLYISTSTMRTHVKNIFSKVNVNNQRALLYLYTQ